MPIISTTPQVVNKIITYCYSFWMMRQTRPVLATMAIFHQLSWKRVSCSLILFYLLRCPTLITGVESHSVGTIYLMNLFSAFTSEVFRPLATILIPGAIGISTWVIALMWRFEELKTLVTNNHTEASLVMLLAMIF